MIRLASVVTLLGASLTLGIAPLQAQEEAPNPFVRESYWKVSYGDLDAWTNGYTQYVAPILAALQEEGLITGFTASTHNTGGRYNFRLALIVPDWNSIHPAVQQLTSRLAGSGAPNMAGMILGHTDNIWELTDLVQREDAPPNEYLYVASFQVKSDQMGAWNGYYEEVWKPALQRAMDAGHLNGWAVEEHAHGGDMNWQLLYLLPSWDAADDVWSVVFAAFEGAGARGQAMMGAFVEHEDNIWETISVETGNDN